MKKQNAILALAAILLLIAGFGYMVFYGVGVDEVGSAKGIHLGLDLAGGVSITYQAVGEESPSAEDMDDTVYKLQQRVEGYSTEALVYKEGTDRVSIEIPGLSDANAVLEELGRPGSLYFIAHIDSQGKQNYDAMGNLTKSIDELISDGSVVLTGTNVVESRAGAIKNDMGNTEYVVELTLDEEGTKKFADATTIAALTQDTIMIYYDGKPASIPVVKQPITGGMAQISGQKTVEEAEQLASTIRIGGLKLELEELRSNVVGAQLGTEAISRSLKAGAIGFGIIVLFMCIVYFVPGLASSIALVLYCLITIFCLNFFDMTLTLPGIAGIVLSIGMAVDANVITFARIREEIASGKSVRSAIDEGYKKALSAIIDGNVTTLIAALVLGVIGTGSIKGFAQTLALGIVVSMITALFVTKLIIRSFYALGIKDAKWYGRAKEYKKIDFLSKRTLFIIISAGVILVGIVAMIINSSMGRHALNFSLEFLGGTSTNVTFNEDMALADIDSKVVPSIEKITGDPNVQVQKVTGSNEVIFKTRALNVQEREAFNDMMEKEFAVPADKIVAETISSTISTEMSRDAVLAIIVATVLMLIYIWFRFKDLRFGASSVICLIHDVLVVITFYALARITVGSTFVACILTIVGYSINATIVIFDRIREKLAATKEDLTALVNDAVNQTLS
ncbi:MAG: protein translocase subunit SecD, partial [Lachnospiraceae bacterium]|nr:protein translocase subunit SecD [Lachnospiraceae bacterium]